MAVHSRDKYCGEDWLINALIRCGAVKFGEFRLTSGRISDYYVDIKYASTQPEILWQIALGMKDIINKRYNKCEIIAGMELGAVPIAAAVSLATGLPYVMVRKKPKLHGTQGRVEGIYSRGMKAVIVEDVVTTGGSIIKTRDALMEVGIDVIGAVVVVDRCEGAQENLVSEGIDFTSLTNATRLKSKGN